MGTLNEPLNSSFKGSGIEEDYEKQPVLFRGRGGTAHHRDEVVVKIDGGADGNGEVSGESKIWRGSSYEFWKGADTAQPCGVLRDDSGFNFQRHSPLQNRPPSPSKMIREFLDRQKASGDVSLDMDLEMEELRTPKTLPAAIDENLKDLRVSFQSELPNRSDILSNPVRRNRGKGSNANSSSDDDEDKDKSSGDRLQQCSGEAIKCSSNKSFERNSTLLRTKTKSRLMDSTTYPNNERRSGILRSGQVKLGTGNKGEEEEEDPFFDEDLPDEYRKGNFGTFTILQWVSLIVLTASIVCSLSIPILERQTIWDLHLWKWELLIIVLICGRLVSGWGIRLVVFIFERNFLLRKRVLYFVYGVRKAVQNCLWLGLVLIAWHYIFDKKVERETRSKVLPYVTKLIVCLLVGTFIWLVKTLLVKVLASSFHVNAFFDRIQEALFHQYVIETLSGPPVVEIQLIKEEEERVMAEVQDLQNAGANIPADIRASAFLNISGKVIGIGKSPRGSATVKSSGFSGAVAKKQEGITIDHLHKLNQKNISAWNMKRLVRIVRQGVLSTLDERLPGASQEDEDDSALEIRSEREAKIAARKIFKNVAKPGSKYIYLVDLLRFLREDEAVKTMNLFEGASDNQKISRRALKNWVIETFRERRALALTLNDTKTAVNTLHQVVNVAVVIIIVIIGLLILGIATTHILVFISSQLLLVVFIFGNTCKTVFEAIIFLFVMHPYDVGDRCEIEGVQMVVEEMNILTTVFLRYDNQKIIYPNSVLLTKPISNYHRSPDMGDAIDFVIHVATPVEKVAMMKERITKFIESNTGHWHPNPTVMLKDIEDMNKLRVSVWFSHRMNHQNMGERWNRRELVVQEMIKVFRDLDIEYRMIPLDVNVRGMPCLLPAFHPHGAPNFSTCYASMKLMPSKLYDIYGERRK